MMRYQPARAGVTLLLATLLSACTAGAGTTPSDSAAPPDRPRAADPAVTLGVLPVLSSVAPPFAALRPLCRMSAYPFLGGGAVWRSSLSW